MRCTNNSTSRCLRAGACEPSLDLCASAKLMKRCSDQGSEKRYGARSICTSASKLTQTAVLGACMQTVELHACRKENAQMVEARRTASFATTRAHVDVVQDGWVFHQVRANPKPCRHTTGQVPAIVLLLGVRYIPALLVPHSLSAGDGLRRLQPRAQAGAERQAELARGGGAGSRRDRRRQHQRLAQERRCGACEQNPESRVPVVSSGVAPKPVLSGACNQLPACDQRLELLECL